MQFEINDIDFKYKEQDDNMRVELITRANKGVLKEIDKIQELIKGNKRFIIEIKQYRQKRSLDANAYCFILCDKIAQVIGNTKEFVYKEAIKAVGVFEILPIKDNALDRWMYAWENKGLGWQSEIYPGSLNEGYTRTINYFGSSVYNTKEMAILLDEIIWQAKELDIETISSIEQKRLIDLWGESSERV